MSRSYSGLRSGAINQTNAFHGQLSSLLSPVDGGNIPIFGKLLHGEPIFTGKIISGDPSFNNVSVYGKLEVHNYNDHFVTYEKIEPYIFSDKNNVIFCGDVAEIFLPEIVEISKTFQISNMTDHVIKLNSSTTPENPRPEDPRMYHWIMTPSEGLSQFDVYPNMFIRIIYTKNTLTNVGKWSIMC
jgi:hypothetical protein